MTLEIKRRLAVIITAVYVVQEAIHRYGELDVLLSSFIQKKGRINFLILMKK
jgi:hypothetical protein